MEAENIGTPINTEADDTGFFVSRDSKTGYFFSFDDMKMRGKGVGRYDLFSFDLYEAARPQEIAFFSGEIKDKVGNVVEGGRVEITNTVTKEKTMALLDSSSGKFMAAVKVKSKDDLLITIKKNDYAFSSKIVSASDVITPKPIRMEVDEVKTGSSFVLNNLSYNTNSAELTNESFVVLESFLEFLNDNPTIHIEIQGHTDNVGSVAGNQALSANRAYTVKAYLEEKGINGKRILAKGYGSSKPIGDNKTEAGRIKNRRTEFLITQK